MLIISMNETPGLGVGPETGVVSISMSGWARLGITGPRAGPEIGVVSISKSGWARLGITGLEIGVVSMSMSAGASLSPDGEKSGVVTAGSIWISEKADGGRHDGL